ncbi:hypothetical protein [Glutamicibacter sp. Je.9.36]|uniref:hypothetical protein n=1 Tax=Glutamicibacter sp. Je.9.36 TaxID=3142837 RepID=UPI003DA7F82A
MAAQLRADRGRGERAGLNIQQIIAKARTMDMNALTMQNVANELHVDRKALNYHVKDRQTLLELVARDTFADGFGSEGIENAATWQEACRAFAHSLTDGVLEMGRLVEHLWFGDASSVFALKPIEALFAQFNRAGCADVDSIRLATMLSTLCLGHARDIVQSGQVATRPRRDALKSDLETVDKSDFTHLVRIAAVGLSTYDRQQLDYSVEIFIQGSAQIIEAKASGK